MKKKTIIGLIIGVVVLLAILLVVAIFAFRSTLISKDEVKNIICEDQNIKVSDASRWEIELEHENGYYDYDVTVIIDRLEHEYVIDAKTGEIIKHEIDR